jgi:hypothetical protein
MGWWQLDKWNGIAGIALKPHTHEAEIARAAAREMLGPNAAVASRLGLWYASGADRLFLPNQPLSGKLPPDTDAAAYFSQFDAVAEGPHMSDVTYNPEHKALLS